VKSYRHVYEVRFENDFAPALTERLREGDVLLLDTRVRDLYSDRVTPLFEKVRHIDIDPTEELKSYQGVEPIVDHLISSGFRKNNRLIAIGGGITQDITAFMASILFRGVDWLFCPTTLLAQCDSCIGSKTSINFGKYKNQIGGFYPPVEIIIDLRFLETLSDLDFRSGMGEMIHYYLVSGEEDFDRILAEYKPSLNDKGILRDLVKHSLEIKKGYIERDEYDTGPRNVFNYGHSFGHAIESLTNYAVPHGIAVSFGMDIANYISVKKGYISEELRERIRELLEMNWGDIRLGSIDLDTYKATLAKDKKAVGKELRVILTKGLGQMFKTPLELDDEVTGWLKECFESFA
jgi:3-dehydroquinate synthase